MNCLITAPARPRARLLAAAALLLFAAAAGAQPQITVSPPSLSASLQTGQSETHTLQIGNTGSSPLDYEIVLSGDSPSGVLVDSLIYDGGNPYGFGYILFNQPPLESVAMRFTVDRPFALSAIRTHLDRLPGGPFTVTVAVHQITDLPFPDGTSYDPTSGPLLATATHVQPGYYIGGPRDDQVDISLGQQVAFEPGEEFFVVLHVDPASLTPVARQATTFSPEANNRAYYLLEGEEDWSRLGRLQGNPYDAIWWIRALSGSGAWLDAAPLSGTVAPGGSADVSVRFDAGGLVAGTYEATLTVSSNDPDAAEVDVPASLSVTAAPDMQVAPTLLDFDALLAGASRTDSLYVLNAGAAPLAVTGVTVYGGPFSVEGPTSFSLAPGERRWVPVTFAPAATGTYESTLTVTGDDPDTPSATVTLTGEALDAPAIAVSPTSISATLAPGETETRTLTVSNDGDSALDFTISLATPEAEAAAQRAAHLEAQGGAPRPADEARRFRAARADAGGGTYADSLYYDDPTGFVQPYYFDVTVAMQYYPQGAFTLTAVRAYLEDVSSVLVDVHRSASNHDPTAGPLLLSTVVSPSGEGPLKELPLGASIPFEAGERFWIVLRPQDTSGLIGATQGMAALPGMAGGGASYYYNGGIPGWDYFLSGYWGIRALSSTEGGLLEVSPMVGTLAAGENLDVTVTLDADGLFAGLYEKHVVFSSNDPVQPTLVVPVTLEVTEAGSTERPAEALAAAHSATLPTAYALSGNHPNPFTGRTTLSYALPEAAHVRLAVYDALGRHVATLVDEEQAAGHHEAVWEAAGAAAGVYVYRIEAGDFRHSLTMMRVK